MNTGSRATVTIALAPMLFGSALAAQQSTQIVQTASGNSATTPTTSQSSAPSVADSHVRIVRLSDTTGEVQMDRNTGRGFEEAILNLPVIQGSRLRTNAGFAELEFEDNSTLRLAPNTTVAFPQLELRQSGATATTVNVEAGTVYVSLARSKGNEFRLSFDIQKILLAPSSHIRLHLGQTTGRLAVLAGSVQLETPTGAMAVGKHKTLTFELAKAAAPTLTNKVAKGRYDEWDQAAIDYHNRSVKSSAYGNSPNLSGLTDMSYYGGFINAADCGPIWRPYFASAAWDPFANGTWAWYPAAGYSWVSPYPWGWLPYHYGAWQYCPGSGWGWQPGGDWVGLKNVPKPKPPRGYPWPPRLPEPPAHRTPTLVAVNRNAPVVSGLSSPGRFVIRQDSAGLGIPRVTLGNLNHISGQVEHHGSANIAVNSVPMIAGNGREAGGGYTPSSGGGRTGEAGYGRAGAGVANYSSSFSASDMGRGASAAEMGREAGGGGSGSMGGGTAGGGEHK